MRPIAREAAVAILALPVGRVVGFVLAARIGQVKAIAIHFVVGTLGNLLSGNTPPLFPYWPLTLQAAAGTTVLWAFGVGCNSLLQPLLTYHLTRTLGLEQESINASIASAFVLFPSVGNAIGPLLIAPLIDVYGTGVALTCMAGLYILSGALMLVAVWPYRNLKSLASRPPTPAPMGVDEQQQHFADADFARGRPPSKLARE